MQKQERLKLKIAVYLILIKENEVLLTRRFQTGWQDGNYSLPAGHLENQEFIIPAMIREAKEEVNIEIKPKDLKLIHVLHRKSNYIDFYFECKNWTGEIQNMEPEKCDEVKWIPLTQLPENMAYGIRDVLENYQQGILLSEIEQVD